MKSCVIGYKIDEKYRRMGYGRRMLTMALKIMVTEYGMHRIEAYILPGNDASVNLASTMGFISEGSAYAYAKINKEWRDHLIKTPDTSIQNTDLKNHFYDSF